MTKRAMDALLDAGADLNITINGRDEYHGRGMSSTTCAVVADSFSDVFAAVAQATRMNSNEDEDDDEGDIVADFTGLRVDNMGKGVVIY
jgi:hypothetical protein